LREGFFNGCEGLVDVWSHALEVLPFALERMGKSHVGSLGVSTGYFGKGMDTRDPVVNLCINPFGFGGTRADKTADITVALGGLVVKLLQWSEGRRGGIEGNDEDRFFRFGVVAPVGAKAEKEALGRGDGSDCANHGGVISIPWL
jgi:hypothetical protein